MAATAKDRRRVAALLEHAESQAFAAEMDASRCDVFGALVSLRQANDSFGAAKERATSGVSAEDQGRVNRRIVAAEKAIEKCCAKPSLAGVRGRRRRKRKR